MKNRPPKLCLLFLVTFFVFSCKTECNHTENTDLSCYSNSKKPSQVITYKEMSEMMYAYDKGAKKELDKYIKKESGGKDTISTDYNWYKLDDLKQYIAYIERISKEKNIPVTGFRITPSEYPKNYTDKSLRNRITIIFTPTTTIGNRDDVAFEPLYSDIGKPVEITKYLEQARVKKVFGGSILPMSFNAQEDLESSSANRIKPTPPY
jgi:hypothetical protein